MSLLARVSILGALALGIAACATSGFYAAKIRPPVLSRFAEVSESQSFLTGSKKGMVVSDDKKAGDWGIEILKKGGNAMDAAIATAFALSVSRPQFASMGGGGILLYCPALKPCTVIDFRERSPFKSFANLYLRNRKMDISLARDGPLAVGTPGFVLGMTQSHAHFGKVKFSALLERPIQWARKGVPVTPYMERAIQDRWSASNDAFKKVMSCDQKPCKAGSQIFQPDLAKTLVKIQSEGSSAFYSGEIKDKILSEVKKAKGILSNEDFDGYETVQSSPLVGHFLGLEVLTVPAPSSSGIGLLQLLYHFEKGRTSVHERIHAMNLSFWERSVFLGDPEFIKVNTDDMLSASRLEQRFDSTYLTDRYQDLDTASSVLLDSKDNTTHFSVVDRDGNAAAMTVSLNGDFGSAFMVDGTGIILNNDMDNFAIEAGMPNQFDVVSGRANLIRSMKRSVTSMAPTILRDEKGNNRLVIGAQGGPRILTSIYQVLVQRMAFAKTLPDAVNAPRFHSQWKPKAVRLEKELMDNELPRALKRLGYSVESISSVGKVHAIERTEDGTLIGGADRRAEGAPSVEE